MIYSYNKNQQDAQFLNFILVKKSTCFGQVYCPSSGRPIVSPQPLVSSPSVSSRTVWGWKALHPHTLRLLTKDDDTRGCGDTIGPPDDEQRAARNMLRSIL